MGILDPEMSFVPKAAIQGTITSLASSYMVGTNARVFVEGFETGIPLWGLAFGVGVLGSLATDAAHTVLVKDTHLSKKHKHQASLLIGSALSGFLFNAGLYFTNNDLPSSFGVPTAFAVGAGSEVASAFTVGFIHDYL